MTKKPLTSEELRELILGLNKVARNLWWTWNQEAQEIFHELSPRGWQNLYHNAVAILHEVSEYSCECGCRTLLLPGESAKSSACLSLT